MNTEDTCGHCGRSLTTRAVGGLCPECLLKVGLGSGPVDGSGAAAGPRARFVPPEPGQLAASFPALEIVALVGQGGMGAVYKARQKRLDRWVALKILPPDIGRDPAFAARFEREARALAQLNHPNIVTLFEYGVTASAPSPTDGETQPLHTTDESNPLRQGFGGQEVAAPCFYFLMEFVDGMNLRELLNAGRIAPREALAIVPQICDALQYAHDHGIVHRDIKPENILLDRQGRVKVADFGLAKLIDQTDPNPPESASAPSGQPQSDISHAVMGTPHYMAPEQYEHPSAVDHRADIYSLGVVFYQMLTGELPKGDFAPPSRKVVIDVRLDEVVLRALEQNPGRRYQQVSDVKTMCETIAANPPPSAHGVTAPPPSQAPRFSRLAIVGACWPLMLFPAMLFWFVKAPVAVPAGSVPAGPSWWQILLLIVIGGFGVTSPLGTTLLGWISVSQIRRSAGRLHGLGLAVFDGVLFPLLLLDGLCAGVLVGLSRIFVELNANFSNVNNPQVHPDLTTRLANLLSQHPGIVWVVTALLLLVVDVLIIRAVWRAVNKGIAPQLPSIGKDGGAKFQSLENITKPRVVRPIAKTAAILWVLLFMFFGLFFGRKYYLWHWEKTHWHSVRMAPRTDSARFVSAVLRVADVSREGRVVVFRIFCEPGLPPADVQVCYQGSDFQTAPTTNIATKLDALFVPTVFGHGTWPGREILHGTNVFRAPGEFTFGFVLPDEERAEMALTQAREMYQPAQSYRLGDDGFMTLFSQILNVTGTNAESCGASLGVQSTIRNVQVESAANTSRNLTFGPQLGCTMPMNKDGLTPLRDLDYGGPVDDTNRSYTAESLMRLKKPGLALQHDPQAHKIIFYGMSGTIVQPTRHPESLGDQWEQVTDMELLALVQSNVMTPGGYQSCEMPDTLPQTIFFKSGGGKPGILQVTEFIDSPRGVKLRYKLVQTDQAIPASATSVASPSFDPIVQCFIATGKTKQSFYSIERDAYVEAPSTLSQIPRFEDQSAEAKAALAQYAKWLADNDVDFLIQPAQGPGAEIALALADMLARPVLEEQFTDSVPELMEAFKDNLAAGHPLPLTPLLLNIDSRLGTLFTTIFKTRKGRIGILQVVSVSDNPRGVNVRYKLVKGVATNAAVVLSPDTALSAPVPVPVVVRSIPALVPIGGILLLVVGGIAAIVLAVRKSRMGTGRTLAVGCGVLMLGFVLVLLLVVVLAMGRAFQAASTRRAAEYARLQSARFAPPVGLNGSFCPVIERVLPFDRSVIDFQTGKIIRPDWEKLSDQDAVERWMSESGVDAIAEDVPAQPIGDGRGYPRLVALGGNSGKERCVFVREETADFDSARAADADGRLKIVAEQDLYWGFANSYGSQPWWWFRTVDGATGLLQLLGTNDHPRGVKIRYKLVQAVPQPVRNPWPLAAHISHGGHSVYVIHDDVDLHYVFYYDGNFGTTGQSSQRPPAWLDQGGIELFPSSRTFGFRRDSDDPVHLQINGKAYDLRQGRVFVLHRDGSLEQRQLEISLATANDPDAMAKVIADNAARGVATPASTAVFGLQAERMIAATDANPDGVVALRFKDDMPVQPPVAVTGHFKDPAKRGFTPELRRWMHDANVDLLFFLDRKSYDVLTLDMRDGNFGQPAEWNTLVPSRAFPALAKLEALNTNPGPGHSGGNGYRDGLGEVRVFRTRDGLVGYYQLHGQDDADGRGVQIRYKLVLGGVTNTAAKPAPPEAAPQRTMLSSAKYAAIAVQTEKDVRFVLVHAGLLSSGMQDWVQNEAGATKWGFEGAAHLVDREGTRVAGRNVDKREIAVKYTSSEPDTLYLDGKAYALNTSGRIFILRDKGEPVQLARTLPLRNNDDLVKLGVLAESELRKLGASDPDKATVVSQNVPLPAPAALETATATKNLVQPGAPKS